ncbi:hypothetical protein PGTUg99_021896 [Puccinia graminis f. sp. tritici]|uniref:Uncharacterized protein n=1 Tax=Puccinia graminis f. sp. tritici TaxID=56615 RepID=A0A5B0SIF6_PUCGR|nr:hypothetical protein PGTUg99_021896 [Puccinia graminis f. sp. tritici]
MCERSSTAWGSMTRKSSPSSAPMPSADVTQTAPASKAPGHSPPPRSPTTTIDCSLTRNGSLVNGPGRPNTRTRRLRVS